MDRASSAIHIESIRRALKNNNAAVMIGAGFSRNAENGHLLKTWADLSEELQRELDPEGEDIVHSPSQVTQLGEQYARVFSVPALEELLKRNIPDQSVSPSEPHEKLLRLPWSEILTTNYDTLLERAAEGIFEQAYFTVCSREDIPLSKVLGRKRIIKLHGSFPSQRPFIFTEEDYRTYPEKFSPFVNLVRQSLIENVFCLIGFSGDDPNFLNWIGWMRDVLQKHSNPVYLFLSSEPSYGSQKLLEARGVTPVVIPDALESQENSYYNRYQRLFDLLKEPLEKDSLEWGELDISAKGLRDFKDGVERATAFVSDLKILAEARKEYPDWLVAPKVARNKLEANMAKLPDSFESRNVIDYLDTIPRELAVAAYSLYSWAQNVLLLPLDDNVAMHAIKVVSETQALRRGRRFQSNLPELSFLGVKGKKEFDAEWDFLIESLFHWARQSLRKQEIEKIASISKGASVKHSEGSDQMIREKVLLRLHEGELDAARNILNDWEPSSSDPFFLVIKASFLAEVGEPAKGLGLCTRAIQKLRRMQRDAPKNPSLLSKEAWACFVCNHIKKSVEFSLSFGVDKSELDGEPIVQELDKRLDVLSQDGYDCHLIVTEILADLNAETPVPTDPNFVTNGFDVGAINTKRNFGFSSELRRKISSAFKWLELAERVGLIPRIDNTTFYIDSYLQAAWWSQYADTTERMLSVLIRTKSSNALKAKDESQPMHKTGWLSRDQVAVIHEAVCQEMCDILLSQVESSLEDLKRGRRDDDLIRFYMDAFSRMVVRVSDNDKSHEYTKRISDIFCGSFVNNKRQHSLWKVLTLALSRAVESLPNKEQVKTVKEIIKIPIKSDVKLPDTLVYQWFDPLELNFDVVRCVGDNPDSEVLTYIDDLLIHFDREHSRNTPDSLLRHFLWRRFYWLNELGFVDSKNKEALCRSLWREHEDGGWPVIPGFMPHATFEWTPEHISSPGELFKVWCLKLEVSSFHSSSAMMVSLKGGSKSWGFPTTDTALISWIESLKIAKWSAEDATYALQKIKDWWNAEGHEIIEDIGESDELYEACLKRFNLMDKLFFLMLKVGILSEREAFDFISAFSAGCGCDFAFFWRVKIFTSEECGFYPKGVAESEVISSVMGGERSKSNIALGVVSDIVANGVGQKFNMLFESVPFMLSADSPNDIAVGLTLLKNNLRRKESSIDEMYLNILSKSLSSLWNRLSYEYGMKSGGVPKSDVPLLRYKFMEVC